MSTLSLLVNNDHWHDSRIINLVVYVCVCTWGGVGFPENDSESPRNFTKCDYLCINLSNWVILEIVGIENP